MKDIISVDVGHLISPGLISQPDFDALGDRYAQVFQDYQASFRDGTSPLVLSLAEEKSIPSIKTLARELTGKYQDFLLLGIGGSALGTRAVMQFLKGPYYNLEGNGPRLFILDNLDPPLAAGLNRILDFKKTGLIYTSKSGSTAETAANFLYFNQRYREAGGDPADIVFICDQADNGINRIAAQLGCRLLHIPHDLQGRYSVISSVGFLPAEIIGVDTGEMIKGAKAVSQSIMNNPLYQNPVFVLGTCLYELARRGKSIHVLFNYSSLLSEFGLWFMQLWGESLGKEVDLQGRKVNAGTTPLSCVGATDQHSLLQLFKEGPADKVFGYLKVLNYAEDLTLPSEYTSEPEYAYFGGHTMGEQLHIEQLSTEMSLANSGHPGYRLTVNDVSAVSLGALFFFYEALVAFVGALWNINPFNQPGVEDGKKITYCLMGRQGHVEKRPEFQAKIDEYNRRRLVIGVENLAE
ncbi:MAG: hypothetical protein ACM3MK_06570 [Chitinophagales bacterium]